MKLRNITELEGRRIASVTAPLTTALDILEREGYEPISSRDMAHSLRIKYYSDWGFKLDSYFQHYSPCTKEALIYAPEEGFLMVRDSPLTSKIDIGEDYWDSIEHHLSPKSIPKELAQKYVQIAEEDKEKSPIEMRAIRIGGPFFYYHQSYFGVSLGKPDVGLREDFETAHLNDVKLMQFLFQDQTKAYGEFLQKNRIDSLRIAEFNDSIEIFPERAFVAQIEYSFMSSIFPDSAVMSKTKKTLVGISKNMKTLTES